MKHASVTKESSSTTPLHNGKEKTPFSPRCDQWESPKGLVYCFDIPGVKSQAIQVVIEGKILRVSGHRPCLGTGECNAKAECAHGGFERTFSLPEGLDEKTATALYHDGILKIEIPRIFAPVPVRVQVQEIQPLPAPCGWPMGHEDEDDMDLDGCLD